MTADPRLLKHIRPDLLSASQTPEPRASQATPGPWTVESHGTEFVVYGDLRTTGRVRVCDLAYGTEANARLIAAAPALRDALAVALAALDLAYPAVPGDEDGGQDSDLDVILAAIQQARAALAKAEGR